MSDKKLEAISKKFSTRKKYLFNVGKHFIKNIDFTDDDGSLNIPKDFSQAMFGMGCFGVQRKNFGV